MRIGLLFSEVAAVMAGARKAHRAYPEKVAQVTQALVNTALRQAFPRCSNPMRTCPATLPEEASP